jgi:hypothetical protein
MKCPECGGEVDRWVDNLGSGYQCLSRDCQSMGVDGEDDF